jgi:replicative DNA helicase
MNKIELVILKHILTNNTSALAFISAAEKPIELFSTDLFLLVKNVIPYIKMYRQIPTLKVLMERSPKTADEIKSKFELVMEQEINEIEFPHDLEMLKRAHQTKLILNFKNSLNATEEYNLDVTKQVVEINRLIKSLSAMDQTVLYNSENVDNYIETYIDDIKNKKPDDEDNKKIKTGLTAFDIASNGGLSKNGDFLIILGETNSGKSMYINTIGINMWLGSNNLDTPLDKITLDGNNIVLFSLEMPYKDYWDRFLGALCGIDYFHIESGKLSKEEKRLIQKARVFMKAYPYKYRIIDYYGKRLTARAMDSILEDVYK